MSSPNTTHRTLPELIDRTIIGVSYNSVVGQKVFDLAPEVPSSDTLILYLNDGNKVEFSHTQDCCESVELVDLEGDWDDLIGEQLLVAEEVTHDFYGKLPDEIGQDRPWVEKKGQFSETAEMELWTFYRLATKKGHTVLRFMGSSNGYYSVDVNVAVSPAPPLVWQFIQAQKSKEGILAEINQPTLNRTPKM